MPECPPHPSPHRYSQAMPSNQPAPGAERKKFSFGKPTGVRVALKMGFWESDGQTRSEALQNVVEIRILVAPISLQDNCTAPERDEMKEDPAQRTYWLVCTEPAVQGCKQEKYLGTPLHTPSRLLQCHSAGLQPTRAEIWCKICKFYLSAKIHASRILLRVRRAK
ncbi:uncharacterized protein TrAFT101_004535 [Trichoderma asperellum]|uniref:Uncharacterized protein n=1 Tax=Trichoderma asperellum (strain ATCC 204424 / CBS 433.97 / NBRC 101777) TaxID=1042311 RepID=A0A2T3ZME3_TRIA4|nr:hypothetical protein M441DRAFT_52783 [Trichoderma asperellum CBS 433.97]PTB45977.1 hypothetical protein M441DRAFT_52783 [Trichoderma asperellum CBS 433.97]UKZ88801.1 hypothetical protein TrAFT101_004535 [Trichoderma asperellum]